MLSVLSLALASTVAAKAAGSIPLYLLPSQGPGHDSSDLNHVMVNKQAQLHWYEDNNSTQPRRFFISNTTFLDSGAVILDYSGHTQVSCNNQQVTVTFTNPDAYNTAKRSWQQAGDFHLLTNHPGCQDDFQRGAHKVNETCEFQDNAERVVCNVTSHANVLGSMEASEAFWGFTNPDSAVSQAGLAPNLYKRDSLSTSETELDSKLNSTVSSTPLPPNAQAMIDAAYQEYIKTGKLPSGYDANIPGYVNDQIRAALHNKTYYVPSNSPAGVKAQVEEVQKEIKVLTGSCKLFDPVCVYDKPLRLHYWYQVLTEAHIKSTIFSNLGFFGDIWKGIKGMCEANFGFLKAWGDKYTGVETPIPTTKLKYNTHLKDDLELINVETPIVSVHASCKHCGMNASVSVGGSVQWTLTSGIKHGELKYKADLSFIVNFFFTASAEYEIEQDFDILDIPLDTWSVPGIFELGPFIFVEGGAGLGIKGEVNATIFLDLEYENIDGKYSFGSDAKNDDANDSGTPKKKINSKGSTATGHIEGNLKTTATLFLKGGVGLGLKVFELDFAAKLGQKEAIEVEVDLAGNIPFNQTDVSSIESQDPNVQAISPSASNLNTSQLRTRPVYAGLPSSNSSQTPNISANQTISKVGNDEMDISVKVSLVSTTYISVPWKTWNLWTPDPLTIYTWPEKKH